MTSIASSFTTIRNVKISKNSKSHKCQFSNFKLCLIIVLLFSQAISSFGQQQFPSIAKESTLLFFGHNEYELSQEVKASIDDIFPELVLNNVTKIIITGHTDNSGSEIYNEALAKARAIKVQEYLVSKGISNNKVDIHSLSERQPLADNASALGRQKNRRVELVVKYNDKVEQLIIDDEQIIVSKKTIVEDKVVKVQELEVEEIEVEEADKLRVPKKSYSLKREYLQFFEVSTEQEIVIEGKRGTKITIPKDAFIDKRGRVDFDIITIELLEIYTKSDMILNNIQTASGQLLLESGGMIYIKAISNTQELSLQENYNFTIEFATEKTRDDMRIFYGEEEESNINWFVTEAGESNVINEEIFLSELVGDSRRMIQRKEEIINYVLESTEMGWINCDRFLNTPEIRMTRLMVNSSDTLDVSFCLVFKAINSVLQNSYHKDELIFNRVPIGQKVTLVAFKKTDQELLYGTESFSIKKDQTITIELENITEKAFIKRLKLLD